MAWDESFVRRAMEHADLNVLRIALLQATGDESLAQMALRKVATRGGSVWTYVVDERHHAELKEKAVDFMVNAADDFTETPPSDAELKPLMDLAWGQPISDKDFAFRRPIAAFEDFPRAASWSEGAPALPEGFVVAIVGAGFSGVAMAAQLEHLGIPYFVIERRSEVGGTWSRNTYPDARVDTHSFGYQYSFEKRYRWSEFYARQAEVRSYVEHVARRLGILEKVEFNTDLREARFDQATGEWELELDGPDGARTRRVSVLVSASGLFGTPNRLKAPGIDSFAGQVVHTAEWRSDTPVTGRRVAIVGNGSTGVQLLSAVAAQAAQVTVYQRTPQWISTREGYGKPVPPEVRWLLDHFPYYWNWTIYATAAMVVEGQELQEVDRDWQRAGGLVNERNDRFRESMLAYIREQLAERPELIEKVTPHHAPMARRLIIDNGWYKALLRDNVELVTGPIERFGEHTIIAADGTERETDLVISATGFQVTKYLWPALYHGHSGRLDQLWDREGGPRAYLGMTVPDFPNLFIMYGPNSQQRAGGSLQTWMESWARYIGQCIVMLVERGASSMAVRQDVFDDYNERLDAASERLVWADPGSNQRNYYVNQWGRQEVNAPWRVEDYYAMLAAPDPSAFDFAPQPDRVLASSR